METVLKNSFKQFSSTNSSAVRTSSLQYYITKFFSNIIFMFKLLFAFRII